MRLQCTHAPLITWCPSSASRREPTPRAAATATRPSRDKVAGRRVKGRRLLEHVELSEHDQDRREPKIVTQTMATTVFNHWPRCLCLRCGTQPNDWAIIDPLLSRTELHDWTGRRHPSWMIHAPRQWNELLPPHDRQSAAPPHAWLRGATPAPRAGRRGANTGTRSTARFWARSAPRGPHRAARARPPPVLGRENGGAVQRRWADGACPRSTALERLGRPGRGGGWR